MEGIKRINIGEEKSMGTVTKTGIDLIRWIMGISTGKTIRRQIILFKETKQGNYTIQYFLILPYQICSLRQAG